IAILILSILIFVGCFIRITNFLYGENWYAPGWYNNKIDNGKWMSQNATILFFNINNEKKATIRFVVESFNGPRNLELYVNGNFVNNYTIENKKEIFQEIILMPRENEIKFHSKEGCEIPSLISKCDVRCLSFKIFDLDIILQEN
ncbi:MAG: hypothetical protein J7K98_04160, partial [Candidatus Aenigmarchaeota archaeon]|nr:hypothetical protein [Candidatus Aenigmarchaeota archaeon]